MKLHKLILNLILLTSFSSVFAQITQVIDSSYTLRFTPIKKQHYYRILFDKYHKTIFSRPSPEHASQVMFQLAKRDGFQLDFIDKELVQNNLEKGDIVVIAGLPNERISLTKEGGKETVLWKSPLSDKEVEETARWVANGGRLMLFLSHYPNGSGGKPLLEAFGVRFRDGGVSHPDYPGLNGDPCAWFTMNEKNKLINLTHPILAFNKDQNLQVNTIRFLCATAIFRNPEDVILSFPDGSTHFAPYENDENALKEESDNYAGMLGFSYGRGKVIVSSDLGVFRNNIIKQGDKLHYNTITDPAADNSKLLILCLRWLSE